MDLASNNPPSAVIAKLLVRRRTVWYLAAHESSCPLPLTDERSHWRAGCAPAPHRSGWSFAVASSCWPRVGCQVRRRAAARYEPGYRPLVAAAMRGGWSRRVAARCAGTRSETADYRRSRTTGRRGNAAPGAATREFDGRHPGPESRSHRIWVAHGLQPHRVRTFKLSTDPAFVEKLPPDKALVFCVDEKSQQALQRQPGLPLKPGRAGTMTHDYQRHGTTTLFAALNVLEGTVIGSCHARHRHQEFRKFLNVLDADTPADIDVHAIVDNYATHKHPAQRWLQRHPNGHCSVRHGPPCGRRRRSTACVALQRRVAAYLVVGGLEVGTCPFKITGIPEQHRVETFSPRRADQALHEWV